MLKNVVKLEVKVAEKVYHLFCDNDSPIGDVKEALFQLTKDVAEIEERILLETKKIEEESKPSEIVVQEANE